jgi:hypothetical protein
MVRIIEDLAGDWRRLDERVEGLSNEGYTGEREPDDQSLKGTFKLFRSNFVRDEFPGKGRELIIGRLVNTILVRNRKDQGHGWLAPLNK